MYVLHHIFQSCLAGWIGVFAGSIRATGPHIWHRASESDKTLTHYCWVFTLQPDPKRSQ